MGRFNFSEGLQRFFYGRYGIDGFTIVLLVFAAILSNIRYVWIISILFTAYAVFRMLSKNLGQRRKEQEAFNRSTAGLRKLLAPAGRSAARGLMSAYGRYKAYRLGSQQGRQFVFVSCPRCRNMLRLPRNKGKLSVTCPVCRNEFIKKT